MLKPIEVVHRENAHHDDHITVDVISHLVQIGIVFANGAALAAHDHLTVILSQNYVIARELCRA